MKYIRTKDGIWKYNLKNNSAVRPNREFKCNLTWLNIKETDIEKSADTIEELCDEFVEVGNHKPFLAEVRFEHWDKQTKNILNKQGTDVYGAIWTDKGLIYVAKMNEKGELELL